LLVVIVFLAGCILGWVRAARRGGKLPDRVQYALAHGIPAALMALVVLVIGVRMGWFG